MNNADRDYEKILEDVDKLADVGAARAQEALKVSGAAPGQLEEVIAEIDADAVSVCDNLLKEAERKEAARAEKVGAAVHILRTAQQLTAR